MTSMGSRVLLLAGATLAVAACNKAGTNYGNTTTTAETTTSTASTTTSASNDPVSSAESAAPAA